MRLVAAFAEVLGLDKSSIGAVQRDELLMASLLDYCALCHDDNVVDVTNSRESMSNDDHGATLGDIVECLLDNLLGAGVQSAGCLVEKQDPRVGDDAASDYNTLFLTAR